MEENPKKNVEEQPCGETQNQNGQDQKRKRKGRPRWANVLLCVGLSAVIFVGGMLTTWGLLDEEMRSLLKVRYLLDTMYYEEIDDDEFYDVVFNAINDNLLDKYSRYLTEEEFEEKIKAGTGAQSGIGVAFSADDGAGMRILRVMGNSPAENAGVVPGSYLTGAGKSAESITPCSNFEEVQALLREYRTGENFYIRCKEGEEEKLFQLAKAHYTENYVFYRNKDTAYRFAGTSGTTMVEWKNPLKELPEDTAYIKLTEFNGNAANTFAQAMDVFKRENKKNLVLDLRGNGGGKMDILSKIGRYFCKDNKENSPIIALADYGETIKAFKSDKSLYASYFGSNSRICVLADKNTASASEALMGCMLDYGATAYSNICLFERGGEAKTYGKGIMQTTIPLLFGEDALKITTAKILWPKSRNCIHDRGILVEDGAKRVAESADEAEICAALQMLFN